MKNPKATRIGLAVLWLLLSGCGQATPPMSISPTLTPTTSHPSATITIPVPSPTTPSQTCKKIAFSMSSSGQDTALYTVCPDGSNLTRLTDQPGSEIDAAWSPDGEQLAFASDRSGSFQVYMMDADGKNQTQLTTDYQNNQPIWLPNGKQIAVRTTDGEGLWWWRIIDLQTGALSDFSEPSYDHFFQTPAWSPDGQEIVYMSLAEQTERNDGASQIHVKAVDGTYDTALTHDTWANIHPTFSPDGEQIAYLSEKDGTYNSFALYVMDRDGENDRALTQAKYTESATFSWSPDGQYIALSDFMWGHIYIVDVQNAQVSQLSIEGTATDTASLPAWQP